MNAAIENALRSQERLAEMWDTQARKDEGGIGIAIGCQNISYRWAADGMRLAISLIRKGSTPQEAVKRAKEDAHGWIVKHNTRRPSDAGWRRWIGSADDYIEGVCKAVEKAT